MGLLGLERRDDGMEGGEVFGVSDFREAKSAENFLGDGRAGAAGSGDVALGSPADALGDHPDDLDDERLLFDSEEDLEDLEDLELLEDLAPLFNDAVYSAGGGAPVDLLYLLISTVALWT